MSQPDWRVIVCADWSKNRGKREVYAASPRARRVWRVSPPPGRWTLDTVVAAATRLEPGLGGSALVGFDAPFGLPASALRATGRATFRDWLQHVDPGTALEPVAGAAEWSIERPFVVVPAGAGSRKAIEQRMAAAGIDWKRRVDVAARANPIFIAGGIAGAVGGSAMDLWRSLRGTASTVAVWPFDGSLNELAATAPVVIGEIYPRLAYALATSELSAELRTPLAVSKTVPAVRVAFLEALRAESSWVFRAGVRVDDLTMAEASEDAFDACVTALGLLRCALEGTPLVDPACEDRIAEGGILGAGSVRLDRPEGRFGVPAGRTTVRAPSRSTRVSGAAFACPIPGCSKVFVGSRGGWDAHVGAIARHPAWHPDVREPEARKHRFRAEFPAFFR
jgi:hypothetical protein